MRGVLAASILASLAIGGIAASCADEPAIDAAVPGGSAPPPDAASDAQASPDAGSDAGRPDAATPVVDSCTDAGTYPSTWLADPRLCLTVFARELSVARQIAFAANGDLFVQAAGKVIAIFDVDGNGTSDDAERSTFASSIEGEAELNHGLAFSPDGAFVYASNDTTVYRWPYVKGDRVARGPAERAVSDMPALGGHVSRTLAFDAQGRLYVNVGTAGDVDLLPEDEGRRGMVRRFTIPATLPAGGIAYASGEVFASGLRNEVGLAFDSSGRMWGVENGSDGIDDDSPAEEINRLDAPGSRFFGHPYCWSEYARDGGLGPRTQWAYRGYAVEKSDAWCRDPANVHPPNGVMRAHWAPLGLAEYVGNSLPWKGDLIIAAHGSSFRSPPVGRLLARAHLVGDDVKSVTPLVGHAVDGGFEEGTWDVRPVDVRSGPDGAVYFSDDFGHRVFRLGYRP